MLQAGRAEKVDKKMVIFVIFIFLSWIMVLKLSTKVHFFNFLLTSAKKSKHSKAIYMHASGRFCYMLSENVIVYYAMTPFFHLLFLLYYFKINLFKKNQSPIFCCPLFHEHYLNPQAGINKMVNILSITTLALHN